MPSGRDLQEERHPNDDQADQDQRVRPVPELAAESPDPAKEDPDDQGRQQEPADEPEDIGARLGQPEVVDRLEGDRGDLLAVTHDRLVLGVVDHDRRDRRSGILAREIRLSDAV